MEGELFCALSAKNLFGRVQNSTSLSETSYTLIPMTTRKKALFTQPICVLVKPVRYRQMRALAKRRDRTLSSEVRAALDAHLANVKVSSQ